MIVAIEYQYCLTLKASWIIIYYVGAYCWYNYVHVSIK